MQVAHTLNNIIKILFNPTIEPFKLFDYLVVKSGNDRYIAQIIELYDDKFDSSQNVAKLKLFFKLSENNEVMPYDNFTPNRECEIVRIQQDEVDNFINQDKKTFVFGTNVKTTSALNLQYDFVDNNAIVLADKLEQANLISLNLAKKLSENKKVVLIDNSGLLELEDAFKIKAPKNFKLPLNYLTIDFVFDKCLQDASLEFQQVVNAIIIEIKKFAKKQEEQFIPFNVFARVLLEQYKATPYTELKLLLSRLKKFQINEIFARTKRESRAIASALEKNNIVIVDISSIDLYWQKLYLEQIVNTIEEDTYLISRINEENCDSNLLNKIYNENKNIKLIPSVSYNYKKLPSILQYCKNYILLPTMLQRNDFLELNFGLANIITNQCLIYGENTESFIYLATDYGLNDQSKRKNYRKITLNILKDDRVVDSLGIDIEPKKEAEPQVQGTKDSVTLINALNNYHNEKTESLSEQVEQTPISPIETFDNNENSDNSEIKIHSDEELDYIEQQASNDTEETSEITLEDNSDDFSQITEKEPSDNLIDKISQFDNEKEFSSIEEMDEVEETKETNEVREFSEIDESNDVIQGDSQEFEKLIETNESEENFDETEDEFSALTDSNIENKTEIEFNDDVLSDVKEYENDDLFSDSVSNNEEDIISDESSSDSELATEDTSIDDDVLSNVKEYENDDLFSEKLESNDEDLISSSETNEVDEYAQDNISDNSDDLISSDLTNDDEDDLFTSLSDENENENEEEYEDEDDGLPASLRELGKEDKIKKSIESKVEQTEKSEETKEEASRPSELSDEELDFFQMAEESSANFEAQEDTVEEPKQPTQTEDLSGLSSDSLDDSFNQILDINIKDEIPNLEIGNDTLNLNISQNNIDDEKLPVFEEKIPSAKQNSQDFKKGTAVSHPKHGKGVVTKIVDYKGTKLLQIEFEETGKKLLDPKVANLTAE